MKISGSKSRSALAGWGQRPTPDIIFTLGYAEGADWDKPHFKDDRFNELLLAARAELDQKRSAPRCMVRCSASYSDRVGRHPLLPQLDLCAPHECREHDGKLTAGSAARWRARCRTLVVCLTGHDADSTSRSPAQSLTGLDWLHGDIADFRQRYEAACRVIPERATWQAIAIEGRSLGLLSHAPLQARRRDRLHRLFPRRRLDRRFAFDPCRYFRRA